MLPIVGPGSGLGVGFETAVGEQRFIPLLRMRNAAKAGAEAEGKGCGLKGAEGGAGYHGKGKLSLPKAAKSAKEDGASEQ